jgi:hypothetical protein
LTQVAVSLTDYGLAVECLWFSLRIARPQQATGSSLRRLFAAFFLSIAMAALAGGTVHGFFLDESSSGYHFLWPFTLIVLGVTALVGLQIGASLQLRRSTAEYVKRSAFAIFLAYCLLVLFVRRDFRIAILGYVPSLIFVGVAFLLAHRRQKKPMFLIGFIGVCTMLLAAAAQQAKIGIHPVYFDHNALYHVLQGIALLMVFLAGNESIKLAESSK